MWENAPVDPFGTADLIMPGPLMTSAIAIFGNHSFFYIAANSSNATFPPVTLQICQQGNIPFSRLGLVKFDEFQSLCYDINSDWYQRHQNEYDLARLLNSWIIGFKDTDAAEEALGASTFFTNQAMLTQTVDGSWGTMNGRRIFTAPGLVIPRPAMTLAGIIIISTLIFLQLIGLAYTVRYIYQVPTWTPALDAIAVAGIGASLKDTDLPLIGPVYQKDKAKLKQLDGLVGVLEDELNRAAEGTSRSPPDDDTVALTRRENDAEARPAGSTASGDDSRKPRFRLALGAPGLIS